MIGYKIMTFREDTNKIHSMADSRLTIDVKKNSVLSALNGIWLGTSIDYVQQYYGSPDTDSPEEMQEGESEVRCTFKYNKRDVIRGTDTFQGTNDPGTEFAVLKVTLIEVYNVTKKEKIL